MKPVHDKETLTIPPDRRVYAVWYERTVFVNGSVEITLKDE